MNKTPSDQKTEKADEIPAADGTPVTVAQPRDQAEPANSGGSRGNIGIFLSAISIVVSVLLTYSNINKKLEHIIDLESGILDIKQALALSRIYLRSIQSDLEINATEYFGKQFNTHLSSGDMTAIENFVYHRTDDVIIDTRNGFSSFTLSGGQTFSAFLESTNPLNDGIILDAKDRFMKELEDEISTAGALGTKVEIEKVKSKYLKIAADAGAQAYVRIDYAIKDLYSGL